MVGNIPQMHSNISVPHMVLLINFLVHILPSKMELLRENIDTQWSVLLPCFLIHSYLQFFGPMLFLQQFILSTDFPLQLFIILLLGKSYSSLNQILHILEPLAASISFAQVLQCSQTLTTYFPLHFSWLSSSFKRLYLSRPCQFLNLYLKTCAL